MDLITPGIGLVFWTSVVFIILVFLLGKFAWKPILGAVKDREKSIEDALLSAEKAREEMSKLQSDHEQLVKEAKAERDNILKEAKSTKDKVIAQAEEIAREEASKIMARANAEIEREREQAFKELKKEVAIIAISAATKILKNELQDKAKQEALVNEYLQEAKLN